MMIKIALNIIEYIIALVIYYYCVLCYIHNLWVQSQSSSQATIPFIKMSQLNNWL